MPRFYRPKELAGILHMSAPYIRALISQGIIPAHRPTSRCILVSEEDLTAFMESRRIRHQDYSEQGAKA